MMTCKIIRGTTDEIDLEIEDADLTSVSEIWITFAQYGTERFTKTLSDVTIDGQVITVPLTQTDTLTLKPNQPLSIQARVLFSGGDADATDIVRAKVGDVLKGGVIE